MATNSAINLATAASGKLVRAQGVGVANGFTTATYPSTAGTAQNVQTSDGTNFISTAPQQFLYYSNGSSTNPTDGSIYYITGGTIAVLGTPASASRFYMLQGCTVKALFININVIGTLGTNEAASLNVKKNGTTDSVILNAITYTATDQNFSNTNIGVSLAAGDYVEFILTNPTWATNPTTVRYQISILIQ